MSDHDAATDPVDKAYVEAEALLGDATADAARRARVLAAVARDPVASGEAKPVRAPSPWRRGGWLAAASVAFFCVLLAARVYQPSRVQLPPASPPTPPSPVREMAAAAPPPKSSVPAAGAAARTSDVDGPSFRQATPEVRKALAERSPEAFPASPAPPPPPPPLAVPSPPALVVPSPSSVGEAVVTGSRMGRRDFGATAPARALQLNAAPLVASLLDDEARLRAAAAAGRTAELEALLAAGARVDAADIDGTTALMESIQAGHPLAAAFLRRHGASLDRKNQAGVSARDMAAMKHDPALDQALGLPSDAYDGPSAPSAVIESAPDLPFRPQGP